MSSQARRKDKGLPGNGGQFASAEHEADDSVALGANSSASDTCNSCGDDLTEDDIESGDGLCEECYAEDLDRRDYEELPQSKKHRWKGGYCSKCGGEAIDESDLYTECNPQESKDREWDQKLRDYNRQGIHPDTTFWTQDDKDALEGAKARALGVSAEDYQDAAQKYDPDL